MSRLVGAGREARGSITVAYLLDLNTIDVGQRTQALHDLADQLDPGSTVEVLLPIESHDAGWIEVQGARRWRCQRLTVPTEELQRLVTAGIHVKLCGPPTVVQDCLAAMQSA